MPAPSLNVLIAHSLSPFFQLFLQQCPIERANLIPWKKSLGIDGTGKRHKTRVPQCNHIFFEPSLPAARIHYFRRTMAGVSAHICGSVKSQLRCKKSRKQQQQHGGGHRAKGPYELTSSKSSCLRASVRKAKKHTPNLHCTQRTNGLVTKHLMELVSKNPMELVQHAWLKGAHQSVTLLSYCSIRLFANRREFWDNSHPATAITACLTEISQ